MVLGCTLAAPTESERTFLALGYDVWTDARCQSVATALTRRYQRGIPIEPLGLMKECVDRAGTDHKAKQVGQFVYELGGIDMPSSGLTYYAERIVALATVRRIYAATLLCGQKVTSPVALDDEDVFRNAVAEMRGACEDALVSFRTQPIEPPMSAAELLSGTDEYDWLVPGLLEYTDRLVITGLEGLGKSFLTAQIAAAVAAGIHPLSTEPLPKRPGGYRVLIVDCENSPRQLRRRFRKLLRQVDEACVATGVEPADWTSALRFVIRPEGISLTEPRELARMEQAVAATAPDLLVIGPMYRLSKVDVRDEQAAKELTDTIDMLRVRHHLTVVIETHAGHGQNGAGVRQLRPLGSSLFLRWPEFGYGLRPHISCAREDHPSLVEVGAWRGSRDERHWPKTLRHGSILPWEPADLDYWNQSPPIGGS
jgi:replicative DNA helicase